MERKHENVMIYSTASTSKKKYQRRATERCAQQKINVIHTSLITPWTICYTQKHVQTTNLARFAYISAEHGLFLMASVYATIASSSRPAQKQRILPCVTCEQCTVTMTT